MFYFKCIIKDKIIQMLKRRLLTMLAYNYEPQLVNSNLNLTSVLVETQPPFCEVCKKYLTEFSCNSIRPTYCPYFEIEFDKNKK